jgi:hypothetical protein
LQKNKISFGPKLIWNLAKVDKPNICLFEGFFFSQHLKSARKVKQTTEDLPMPMLCQCQTIVGQF